MVLQDYDFTLPQERIAQHPHQPADECKLLVYAPHQNTRAQDRKERLDTKKLLDTKDTIFKEISSMMNDNDVIIGNDSRVIKARIAIRKAFNGEIFYLRPAYREAWSKEWSKEWTTWWTTWWELDNPYTLHNTCEALISPGKKFRIGEKIILDEIHATITVLATTKEWRILHSSRPRADILEEYGQMPLPPYVKYTDNAAAHYQSLFAHKDGSVNGSVAAPTASLHFTQHLIDTLRIQWVTFHTTTLHIGLWTFQRVETKDITQHPIHDEQIECHRWLRESLAQEKRSGKNHTAVWTTVMRTIESMPYLWTVMRQNVQAQGIIATKLSPEAIQRRDETTKSIDIDVALRYIPRWWISDQCINADTQLFLHPGIPTRIIDALITNFHLPKSSLLMLVAAFVWYETMLALYTHAQKESYMFYSFGDAMLLDLRRRP